MAENIESSTSTLEFFMLIGKLKHLKRTGWVLRNIQDCESVSGHMYRMGIMAFLLGDNLQVDRDRCIKMALVHDMAECIVGDITPFCGVSKEEKHRREMEAMEKLTSLVGKKVGKEFLELFQEYEEKLTAEAKAVHDLDKFDMLLQAYEYEDRAKGSLNLQGFFDNTKGFETPAVLKWLEELQVIRNKNSPPFTE